MATCAIFNYQFDKIIEQARQKEIEGMESVVMTADEVKTFISEVRSKGSILPEVDIEKYVCETIL